MDTEVEDNLFRSWLRLTEWLLCKVIERAFADRFPCRIVASDPTDSSFRPESTKASGNHFISKLLRGGMYPLIPPLVSTSWPGNPPNENV